MQGCWYSPGVLRQAAQIVRAGCTLAVLLSAAVAAGVERNVDPVAAPTAGSASPSGCHSNRAHDEFWIISSRGLSGCAIEPSLQYHFLDGNNHWVRTDAAAFLAGDQRRASTCVYVHGNRIAAGSVAGRGRVVYRALVRGIGDGAPLRFVCWSWPSDRIKGHARDVRVKAARTDAEGYYLGWLLSQMDPQDDVSLIGFSLGARIVTGAAHLLGGGALAGRQLASAADQPRVRPRAALLAAALDNDWLLPGRYHGRAIGQTGGMLSLYNSCDPLLQRYRFVRRCGRPQALGYAGLASPWMLGAGRNGFQQHDVSYLLGRDHNWAQTVQSPGVMQRVQQFTLPATFAKD